MKLSLVTTHYNEPRDVVEKLFVSLREQRMVNPSEVEVIIVEDGTYYIPDDVYKDLPFEVYHHHPEHGGISAARNYGLEQAKGDYVMFCDCDDMFLNALGLHLIMCAIEEEPEVISSAFIEETRDSDGQMHIVRHDNDMTFIHGKVFKRSFLRRENLKFDKDLTVHEDGYFVRLCFALQKYKKYIETPFYLWCWRQGSVCRKEEFVLKTYPELMKARIAFTEMLKKKGMEKEYAESAVSTFVFAYYDFQKPAFNNAAKYGEYIVAARKSVRKYWRKYKEVIRAMPKREIANCMYMARQTAFKDGLLYETMTLFQFIRVLEE